MSSYIHSASIRALDDLARYLELSESLRLSHRRAGANYVTLEPPFCPYLRTSPPPFDVTSSRVMDHCMVFARAYATLEYFVYERLSSYLAFLQRNVAFVDLPTDTRLSLRRGTAKIITNIESERFQKFSEADVSANYAAALAGDPFELTPAAILSADQNYRFPEICRLFQVCGLSGLKDVVENAPEIVAFFREGSRESDTVEGTLKALVQRRNEASHGLVDQVAGPQLLQEAIEFTKLLIAVLYRVSREHLLEKMLELGRLSVCGTVLETYRDNVAVVSLERFELRENQIVASRRRGKLQAFQIESLRFDDYPVRYLRGSRFLEAGLKLDNSLKRGRELYVFDNRVDFTLL